VIVSQLDEMHEVSKKTVDESLVGIKVPYKNPASKAILADLNSLYDGVPGNETKIGEIKGLIAKNDST